MLGVCYGWCNAPFNRGYGLTELNTSVVPRSLVHSSPAWRGNKTANRTHSVAAGFPPGKQSDFLVLKITIGTKSVGYRAFCMADHCEDHAVLHALVRVSTRVVVVVVRELFYLVTPAICVWIRGRGQRLRRLFTIWLNWDFLLVRSHHNEFVGTIWLYFAM